MQLRRQTEERKRSGTTNERKSFVKSTNDLSRHGIKRKRKHKGARRLAVRPETIDSSTYREVQRLQRTRAVLAAYSPVCMQYAAWLCLYSHTLASTTSALTVIFSPIPWNPSTRFRTLIHSCMHFSEYHSSRRWRIDRVGEGLCGIVVTFFSTSKI